jgi:hypothetical protein
MWKRLNTKTSTSLYGTLVVKTKSDLCGVTVSYDSLNSLMTSTNEVYIPDFQNTQGK